MNPLKLIATLTAVLASLASAEPPRIVRMTPDHGDVGVDPALKQVRFEFDQDMAVTGASICGGGARFPKLTGKPKWESPRILVLPVELEAGHAYDMSLNCPAAQNTKSVKGEAAEITPLSFRTGAAGEPPPASLTREVNEKAIDTLRKAIDLRYSYRDLRVHDWDALWGQNREAMSAATSRAGFARAACRMLTAAGDVHVTLAVGEARFATLRAGIHPNVDVGLLGQIVPGYQRANDWVATGRFEDGTAYLSISGWPAEEAPLAPAHALLDTLDARALILDVRANGGGDEPAAQRFASRFARESAVYSRHRYRDGEGGWGPVLDRVIEPSTRKHFDGPVVVLMGQGCVSSNESFLCMMRYGAHAKLVGEPSYGSSGNPKPIDLGNGVTIYLPSWEDQLPDDSILEGRGVQPDVNALLGSAPAQDGVLEAALGMLRK